ncbi:putative nucleotidyltransferase substrate binding domain-containing protein, partial [Effusibacillus lacus]
RELARGFRDWLIKRLRHQSFIHWQMADHIGSHQVPLDFWGRFRTDQRGSHANQLNIKEGGYLPLVNLTRLWSITAGIQDTNTDCRIDALMRRWFWDERFGNRVKEAFHTFLGHRIWGHYLEPDSLTEREKNALKTALETVRHLQKQSVQHFRKPK